MQSNVYHEARCWEKWQHYHKNLQNGKYYKIRRLLCSRGSLHGVNIETSDLYGRTNGNFLSTMGCNYTYEWNFALRLAHNTQTISNGNLTYIRRSCWYFPHTGISHTLRSSPLSRLRITLITDEITKDLEGCMSNRIHWSNTSRNFHIHRQHNTRWRKCRQRPAVVQGIPLPSLL